MSNCNEFLFKFETKILEIQIAKILTFGKVMSKSLPPCRVWAYYFWPLIPNGNNFLDQFDRDFARNIRRIISIDW